MENRHDVVLSFTPGFPMADFEECGMAVFGYGPERGYLLRGLELIDELLKIIA